MKYALGEFALALLAFLFAWVVGGWGAYLFCVVGGAAMGVGFVILDIDRETK